MAEITEEGVLPNLLKRSRFGSLEELYNAIGYGGQSAAKSVGRMKDELIRLGKAQAEKAAAEKLVTTGEEVIMPASSAQTAAGLKASSPKRSQSGIIVEGLDNCLVKFAKCCTPVPGDPVVGFITRGFGVSVHRSDCPNAQPENRKPEEAGRWIKVDWAEGGLPGYRTALELSAKDRDGLALDVAMALSAAKVRVPTLSAKAMPDGYAVVSVEVEVQDRGELANIMNKLGQIQGVYQVKRATG